MKLLLAVSALLISVSSQANLRTFESDLCTMFPNGKWGHCCFEHDLHYWAGGTKERRNWADRELRQCVRDTGKKRIAEIMYWGVKLGRLSPVKLKSKRWGNAFLGKRKRYKQHSYEEILIIVDELQHYDFDPELKNKLLDSLEYFVE